MQTNEILAEASQIASLAKSLELKQEDISIATGISQSQVSRVLSGRGKRKSKAHNLICNYVNSLRTRITPDHVIKNEELINAIAEVWDGTEHQSKAIASVIRSLGLICSTSNQK